MGAAEAAPRGGVPYGPGCSKTWPRFLAARRATTALHFPGAPRARARRWQHKLTALVCSVQVEVTDRVGLLHDVTQALWERELTGASTPHASCATRVRSPAADAHQCSPPRARVHEPQRPRRGLVLRHRRAVLWRGAQASSTCNALTAAVPQTTGTSSQTPTVYKTCKSAHLFRSA